MNIQYFFSSFPVLDLGDIILRAIRRDDAQDYFDYMNRQEMRPFLAEDSTVESVAKAIEEVDYWKSLFPSKKSIYWAIALKETDQMIGTAGFNVISFSNSKAEISYDLSPDYWGKGIMLKSIKAILQFADNCLELQRVQATSITDNDRSIKLLERCGFQQEGLLKQYELVEGKHRDYYMYSRVPS